LLIGIKDLSQMITSRTLFISIISVYFISDFFFTDAMLYITGGVIGGTIEDIFKSFGKKTGYYQSLLVWVGLLTMMILLLYRLRNKLLKFFILLLIAALLYVVDFVRMELLPINVHTITARYFVIAISVLSKSCLLYLIIYYDRNQRILISKPQ